MSLFAKKTHIYTCECGCRNDFFFFLHRRILGAADNRQQIGHYGSTATESESGSLTPKQKLADVDGIKLPLFHFHCYFSPDNDPSKRCERDAESFLCRVDEDIKPPRVLNS